MVSRSHKQHIRCPLLGWRLVRRRTNLNASLPLPLSASTALQNVPLPYKITSRLTLLLLWLPVKQHLMEAHSRSMFRRGEDTQSTMNLAALETSSSLAECHETKRSKSWELFPMAVREGRFSGPGNAPLAKSSVSSTLNFVAATSGRT